MCDDDDDTLMPCNPPAWAWFLVVTAAAASVVKFTVTQLGWFNG